MAILTDGASHSGEIEIVKRNLTFDELGKWFDFLSYEVFPGDSRDVIEDMWYGDSEKDVNGIFVATEPCGNIIASVKAGCRMLNIHNYPVYTGIISGVGTKKEYRGRGISKQLFEMCHNYMKEKGVKLSHLYSNLNTLEFYRHLGYRDSLKHPDESFYRMYLVISPFTLGDMRITDTNALIRII